MDRNKRIGVALSVLALVISIALLPVVGQDNAEEVPITLNAVPAGAEPLPSPPLFPPTGRTDYQIGRQDLLEIEVFGVEDLSQVVRVSDDGSITMPLLGRLAVAGLSKTDLQDLIARLLGERFVHDPQVTVFVREYESKKVAVSGAVRNPGSYEMLGRKTLLEMISMAGGLDKDLGREIIIFRPTKKQFVVSLIHIIASD